MGFSIKTLFLLITLLAASQGVFATIDVYEFQGDLDRQRYQTFIEEMRCPKCQNQNLAGSDSPISADLRRELYEMIKFGKSDQEIVDYMVKRYGEFILYRPRIAPVTYVLWVAPVVLLLIGLVSVILILRQRRRLAAAQLQGVLSEVEQKRLASLLDNYPSQHQEPRL